MWKRLRGLYTALPRIFQGVKSRIGISFKNRYISPVLSFSLGFFFIILFSWYFNYFNSADIEIIVEIIIIIIIEKRTRKKVTMLIKKRFFSFSAKGWTKILLSLTNIYIYYAYSSSIDWMSWQGLLPKNHQVPSLAASLVGVYSACNSLTRTYYIIYYIIIVSQEVFIFTDFEFDAWENMIFFCTIGHISI